VQGLRPVEGRDGPNAWTRVWLLSNGHCERISSGQPDWPAAFRPGVVAVAAVHCGARRRLPAGGLKRARARPGSFSTGGLGYTPGRQATEVVLGPGHLTCAARLGLFLRAKRSVDLVVVYRDVLASLVCWCSRSSVVTYLVAYFQATRGSAAAALALRAPALRADAGDSGALFSRDAPAPPTSAPAGPQRCSSGQSLS